MLTVFVIAFVIFFAHLPASVAAIAMRRERRLALRARLAAVVREAP